MKKYKWFITVLKTANGNFENSIKPESDEVIEEKEIERVLADSSVFIPQSEINSNRFESQSMKKQQISNDLVSFTDQYSDSNKEQKSSISKLTKTHLNKSNQQKNINEQNYDSVGHFETEKEQRNLKISNTGKQIKINEDSLDMSFNPFPSQKIILSGDSSNYNLDMYDNVFEEKGISLFQIGEISKVTDTEFDFALAEISRMSDNAKKGAYQVGFILISLFVFYVLK